VRPSGCVKPKLSYRPKRAYVAWMCTWAANVNHKSLPWYGLDATRIWPGLTIGVKPQSLYLIQWSALV
jgi:hypothetical protein